MPKLLLVLLLLALWQLNIGLKYNDISKNNNNNNSNNNNNHNYNNEPFDVAPGVFIISCDNVCQWTLQARLVSFLSSFFFFLFINISLFSCYLFVAVIVVCCFFFIIKLFLICIKCCCCFIVVELHFAKVLFMVVITKTFFLKVIELLVFTKMYDDGEE